MEYICRCNKYLGTEAVQYISFNVVIVACVVHYYNKKYLMVRLLTDILIKKLKKKNVHVKLGKKIKSIYLKKKIPKKSGSFNKMYNCYLFKNEINFYFPGN